MNNHACRGSVKDCVSFANRALKHDSTVARLPHHARVENNWVGRLGCREFYFFSRNLEKRMDAPGGETNCHVLTDSLCAVFVRRGRHNRAPNATWCTPQHSNNLKGALTTDMSSKDTRRTPRRTQHHPSPSRPPPYLSFAQVPSTNPPPSRESGIPSRLRIHLFLVLACHVVYSPLCLSPEDQVFRSPLFCAIPLSA